ncbi:MAG TPA: phosphate ABC transporter substrate-binding protein PstS [Candidatus Acidoferrum sp.]|nr:phosphate ABC transporter substrate-binding protein PstS [Candidatus Acidoferrum sp.]
MHFKLGKRIGASDCAFMAARLIAVVLVLLVWCACGKAQTAETLSQVKKVYVETFGQENGASALRQKTIDRLREKGRLEIVGAAKEADAVIRGTGSIWLTGYVSTDPRSPTNARQPIYHGYLSVEIAGKNGEPLWSYLVTPSKFRAGDIAKDLADHLVTKLFSALTEKNGATSISPGARTSTEVTLNAAGATFPAPLYQRWFELFEERNAKVHVKYRAIGSGSGLQLLMDGKLDFAASDMPLSDAKMAGSKKAFLHFASVVGAVVPAYNLKGLDRSLNFTPEVLAGIYLGKIRKWNDRAIRDLNRSAALPDAEIVVVHRSDGSGTTFVWTDYLSKLSAEWQASLGSGTEVQWPVGTGAEGNEGVAEAVRQTANSIGYMELVYALRHQLSFGAVRNAAGQFLQADLPSVTTAAAEAAGAMSTDSRVSITNAAGKGAYPIASFTWWLLPEDLGGADKRAAVHELIEWMLSSGQKECSALGYAPLPKEVVERELQLLNKAR